MINDIFDKKLVIFSLVLICSIFIFNFNHINALTQTNNYDNGSATGLNGKVYTERFTGLPTGSVNTVSLKINNTGSIKQESGGGACVLAGSISGTFWAQKASNLQVGATITSVNVIVNSNFRTNELLKVGVYKDDGIGGAPSTLISSGQAFETGNGYNNVTVSAPVPASGNVWVGFMTNATASNICWDNAPIGTNANVVGASFASVPNPFPSSFSTTNSAFVTGNWLKNGEARVKLYQDNGIVATHTQLHDNEGFRETGGDNLMIQKFTGLPAGGKISALEHMFWSSGSYPNSRTKIFDNTGTLQDINTVAHNNNQFSINGGSGIWLQQFSGLTAGKSITGVGLEAWVNGQPVNVCCTIFKIYSDNAGVPNTLLGESTAISSTESQTGLHVNIPSNGIVWAGGELNYSGGLPNIGYTQTGGECNFAHTFGTGPSTAPACSSPQFLLWTKLYYNGANETYAGNLIGEAATNGGTTASQHQFASFPVNATIPNDGVVWAGTEFSSASNQEYANGGTGQYSITHTFGTGPTVAPQPVYSNQIYPLSYTFRLDYSAIAGAGTLLAESNSIRINSTGQQDFPLTSIATIPASGNVWGAYEVNSASVGLRELTKALTGLIYNYTHTYGTGPNPISGDSNNTHPVWMQISYTVPTYSVSLKPFLHDGVTPITSGKLIVTQNGVTIGTGNTNSSGYATVSGVAGGNYNFTIMDDKNFAVYKELNTVVSGNIARNVSTYDTPFNCISPFTGYQSDVILRINDTDGTHVTNISTPTCANQNQISFNMTFAGNGQSGNTFSSSMITTAGSQVFAANPASFTVSGTTVPTTFTQGNNIVSNSFSIGSGLVTTVKNFVIILTTTHGTGSASQSSGQNYFTNNSTCFAGVFDPKSSSCVFGPINISIPPVTIITNTNQTSGNIGISCDGTGSLTVTSINLGNNLLGIQVGQLPVTVNCGTPTPTQCPSGTTLTNGVCIAPLTCPVGSQTQNGICTGQLTCPDGTTLQNSQCIAQPTCPAGSVMVNGQCQDNGIPIILPPTPSPCSITDPVACVTTTTQSQDVVVTATTSDGRVVSSTTTLTKVINPELNNVSLVIILLIIAAIIAGIIYRYLTRKPKKQNGSRHGKSKKIEDFNKSIRKS